MLSFGLKSIYFNHNLTNNISNYRNKNPSGIRNKLFNNIGKICTVDKYQGQQNDYIILLV